MGSPFLMPAAATSSLASMLTGNYAPVNKPQLLNPFGLSPEQLQTVLNRPQGQTMPINPAGQWQPPPVQGSNNPTPPPAPVGGGAGAIANGVGGMPTMLASNFGLPSQKPPQGQEQQKPQQQPQGQQETDPYEQWKAGGRQGPRPPGT